MAESDNESPVLDLKEEVERNNEKEASENKEEIAEPDNEPIAAEVNREEREPSEAKPAEAVDDKFRMAFFPKKAAPTSDFVPAERVIAKALPPTVNPEGFKCPYCTCANARGGKKFSRITTFAKPGKLESVYAKVKAKQADRADREKRRAPLTTFVAEVEKRKIEDTKVMEAYNNNQANIANQVEASDKPKSEVKHDEVGDECEEICGVCRMAKEKEQSDVNDHEAGDKSVKKESDD